jgi:hypothetical protein
MDVINLRGTFLHEMAKIFYFSIKTLFVICSTWLVAPIAEMIDQPGASTPPIFMFWFFNFLLFSHEVVILLSSGFRRWLSNAFINDQGKLDHKQLLASGLSLWCIRLFVHGKLLEVYYGGGFDDKTYYYLIVIIMILVGGVVLEKGVAAVLKRIFEGKN